MNKSTKLFLIILLNVGFWGLIYKGVLMIFILLFVLIPHFFKFQKTDYSKLFKFENRFILLFFLAIFSNLLLF